MQQVGAQSTRQPDREQASLLTLQTEAVVSFRKSQGQKRNSRVGSQDIPGEPNPLVYTLANLRTLELILPQVDLD